MTEQKAEPKRRPEVVIVTGAARGLGREITEQLLRGGATVVAGCSGDPHPLEVLAKEYPGQVRIVVGDVGEERTSVRLVEEAQLEHGPTAVIHNAAIARDGLLVRLSAQEWDEAHRVNLRGAFLLSKHAVRAMMRNRRGRMVFISSMAAVYGNIGQVAYAASKSGLEGLSRSISQEYARFGVGTCVLAPGMIKVGLGTRLDAGRHQEIADRFLLGSAEAQEIAGIAVFLASDAARFINATVVNADGGGKM